MATIKRKLAANRVDIRTHSIGQALLVPDPLAEDECDAFPKQGCRLLLNPFLKSSKKGKKKKGKKKKGKKKKR